MYLFRELRDLGGILEHLDDSSLGADSFGEHGGERLEDVVAALAKVERLSAEQVSICQYRHMLLCYLDRLDTYEVSQRIAVQRISVCTHTLSFSGSFSSGN